MRLRVDVLEAAHVGHPGRDSMLRQLRTTVWWPGITKDVKDFVESCVPCAASTPSTMSPRMVMRETPDSPWQHVSADFKGPIGGQYYIHVMIDNLSRWPEVVITKNTRFSSISPKLEDTFALHGVPESITSDNGPPYQSEDWKRFAKEQGFQIRHSTPEHPEGNGLVERFMAVLKKIIHAALVEKKDPKVEIRRRLLNYRNTIHPSTGKTPAELMMGRNIRTRLPGVVKVVTGKALEEARKKDTETRTLRKEKFDEALAKAKICLFQVSDENNYLKLLVDYEKMKASMANACDNVEAVFGS